ncbi:MAG: hypothetical protein ACOCXH_12085 [Cyclobacteriaceae bacterium]
MKDMVTVIKRGSTKEQIKAELDRRDKKKKKKGIDLDKYCGSINLKEDPLKLQKQWRDEWE